MAFPNRSETHTTNHGLDRIGAICCVMRVLDPGNRYPILIWDEGGALYSSNHNGTIRKFLLNQLPWLAVLSNIISWWKGAATQLFIQLIAP